jgi:subtilisin family serine protease
LFVAIMAMVSFPPSPMAEPSAQVFEALAQKAAANGSVRIIVGFASTPPTLAAGEAESDLAKTERIAAGQDALLATLPAEGVSGVKRFSFIPYLALAVDAAALESLRANPLVTGIQEDKLSAPDLAQSAPLVNADDDWYGGFGGAGWTVAILDTGVNGAHGFLSGSIVSEACYSTTDAANDSTTVCPGGVESSIAAGSGVNCSASVAGCDHGTHVAGIATGHRGTTDGGTTYFNGVAPEAMVIAIQIFSRFDDDGAAPDYCAMGGSSSPCALTWDSDQILGLERVYALRSTYNIAAVNMSIGGGKYTSTAACDADSPAVKTAIDNLRGATIATVISSGNSGYSDGLGSPGCISTAVSVGATTKADAVASYSNTASFLSLLAPGSSITSSVPGGSFSAKNGTSMAAPHVTGAWAILKQRHPTATVSTLLTLLQDTGKPIVDTRPAGADITKSRIDVGNAIGFGAPLDASFAAGVEDPLGHWSTGGNAPWSGQGTTVLLGGMAARSGDIADNGVSWLSTTRYIHSPDTISFYWKVSSENNWDFLRFLIDGVEQMYISGEVGWVKASFPVSVGLHTFTWKYTKDSLFTQGADAGYVDQIRMSTWSHRLTDNGPLVNSVGTGYGGADESVVQTSLGLIQTGYSATGSFWLTDDLTVKQLTYLRYVDLYAYQTQSSVASPITGVHMKISDAADGTIMCGDDTTNRMVQSHFSDIYRITDPDHGDSDRPIMAIRANLACTLPPGRYWIMWSLVGSAKHTGPWAPPVTVNGQTITGNAQQWNGSSWGAIVDGSSAQGLPFQIEGRYILPTAGDFGDADSQPDLAVYYPANGNWYTKPSDGTGNVTANWGWNATIPVPADYDGDALLDVAVYYPSNGTWYIKGSAGGNVTKNWGWAATIPVPADYDGDGMVDLAVYYPSNGTWYVKGSAGTNLTKNWGWAATTPVPADYDGDGLIDLAVYYQVNGTWYIKGSNGTNITKNWGWNASMPVQADWDADGITDLAVYYPTNGTWYIKGITGTNQTTVWGWNAAWPVPADWDGDGVMDLAVYYPTNGTWYIKGSGGTNQTINWGWAGAQPVFPQYQINRQTGFITN